MTLADRRARILSFIVEDYVDSAQPIGSKNACKYKQELGFAGGNDTVIA